MNHLQSDGVDIPKLEAAIIRTISSPEGWHLPKLDVAIIRTTYSPAWLTLALTWSRHIWTISSPGVTSSRLAGQAANSFQQQSPMSNNSAQQLTTLYLRCRRLVTSLNNVNKLLAYVAWQWRCDVIAYRLLPNTSYPISFCIPSITPYRNDILNVPWNCIFSMDRACRHCRYYRKSEIHIFKFRMAILRWSCHYIIYCSNTLTERRCQ